MRFGNGSVDKIERQRIEIFTFYFLLFTFTFLRYKSKFRIRIIWLQQQFRQVQNGGAVAKARSTPATARL